VPTLVVIGYPDETSAAAAAEEVLGLAGELVLEAEAIAVISRNRNGGFQVDTNHHAVPGGTAWGLYWALLFGVLFFAPVFGTAVGVRLGALGGRTARSGIDPAMQARIRDLPQPGTSALFLVVDRGTRDAVVERLQRFGGTVLTAPLTLATALPGEWSTVPTSAS